MREVAGAVMAMFTGLLLLWFMIPMLNTIYETIKQQVDLTNDVNVTLLTIGDGVYLMLGPVIVVIIGYLIFSYATRNLPVDL